MTAQWQRSTTPLRDRRPIRCIECIGECGQTTFARDTCEWAICTDCERIARAHFSATTRGITGPEYRAASNQFWSSEKAVRAAVAEQREAVTV